LSHILDEDATLPTEEGGSVAAGKTVLIILVRTPLAGSPGEAKRAARHLVSDISPALARRLGQVVFFAGREGESRAGDDSVEKQNSHKQEKKQGGTDAPKAKAKLRAASEEEITKCIAQQVARSTDKSDTGLESLSDRFIGQEKVVSTVKTLVDNHQSSWRTSTNPLVLLFLGPPGTGKTELAKQVAASIHGADIQSLEASKKFVAFSMGQFQAIGTPHLEF